MARAKRKVAYRKRNQNRFSMFLVSLVVLMIVVVVAVKSVELQDKIDAKAREEEQLNKQIAAEEERTQEIEEFGKEVQTKGYIEDVAREKLGLVYEDEILFKEDN
ncbi:MAG: septum formation initiator family protein [Acetatifactor sp.]